MRVSVVQMSPTAERDDNIAQAGGLMAAAMLAGRPDLLALPEMWTCLGGDLATKRAAGEVLPPPGSGEPGGPAYEFLRGFARTHQVHVHGGSIGELADGMLYNTSLVFSPDGTELARYRKIHLFDITTPDGQGFRESATYGAGRELVTCTIDGMTVGLAICYDLRFAELFLGLRRLGAELIVLPAAFTLQTGKDHWEVLLRARAIETQCWIAAPACFGPYRYANGEIRQNFGHAMICDPWGHVVARASDGPGAASAAVDRAFTARVRANMPVLEHRVLTA
jgi:nitrilase